MQRGDVESIVQARLAVNRQSYRANPIRAIKEAIELNTWRIDLQFACLDLTDSDVLEVVGMLKAAKVRTLGLSSNKITDTGAVALAEALHYAPTLEVLGVGNNDIRIAGVRALIDSVKAHPNIKEFCVWGNSHGEAGEQALMELKAARPEIRITGPNEFKYNLNPEEDRGAVPRR